MVTPSDRVWFLGWVTLCFQLTACDPELASSTPDADPTPERVPVQDEGGSPAGGDSSALSARDSGASIPKDSGDPLLGLAACPTDVSTPIYSTMPMKVEDFHVFRPLGFITHPTWVLPTYHSNFAVAAVGQTIAEQKPVVFPAAGRVTQIRRVYFTSSGQTGYQVDFRPCQKFLTYFNHLKKISDRLDTELKKVLNESTDCVTKLVSGNDTITTCNKDIQIDVLEGELIGYSGDSAGVDFGAIDERLPAPAHVIPSHYNGYRNYVSPIPYFKSTVRTEFEKKLGSVFDFSVKRTATPVEGAYVQDVAGTAQGNWFSAGRFATNPDNGGHMALVHDYIAYDDEPIMSIGSTALTGIKGIVGIRKPVATSGTVNRDWKQITSNGLMHCFDAFTSTTMPSRGPRSTGGLGLVDPKGIILMQMTDATHLKAEWRSATTCAADTSTLQFTAAATLFER